MRKICFMRHGQTEWNRLGRMQGQTDNPLNDPGRAEAKTAAAWFKEIPVDLCLYSPLDRARETAEIVMKGHRVPLKMDNNLLEISYGSDEGIDCHKVHTDPAERLYHFYHHPEHFIPPEGGESIRDLQERCQRFLRQLEKIKEYQCILAVCHGAYIRGIVSCIQRLEVKDFWKGQELTNCGAMLVVEEDGIWSVENESINTLL